MILTDPEWQAAGAATDPAAPASDSVATAPAPADPAMPADQQAAAPADTTLSGIQPLYFKVQAEDDPSVHIREKSSFALPGLR